MSENKIPEEVLRQWRGTFKVDCKLSKQEIFVFDNIDSEDIEFEDYQTRFMVQWYAYLTAKYSSYQREQELNEKLIIANDRIDTLSHIAIERGKQRDAKYQQAFEAEELGVEVYDLRKENTKLQQRILELEKPEAESWKRIYEKQVSDSVIENQQLQERVKELEGRLTDKCAVIIEQGFEIAKRDEQIKSLELKLTDYDIACQLRDSRGIQLDKRDELLDQVSFEISHILKHCPVLAMSIMTRLKEWLNQVQKLRESKE